MKKEYQTISVMTKKSERNEIILQTISWRIILQVGMIEWSTEIS